MFSQLNRFADFNDFKYGDILIFEEARRLIFTTITEILGSSRGQKFKSKSERDAHRSRYDREMVVISNRTQKIF